MDRIPNYCSGLTDLRFAYIYPFFVYYLQSFVCMFAARSAMQLEVYKYAFTIKWNVPKAIQRMHHMGIYLLVHSQLSPCLPLFFFTLSVIFRDANWRPGLQCSLMNTNMYLRSNGTFQT